MKLLLKPYNLLFAAAALLLVWFWLVAKPVTIDIHIHDTYIVTDIQVVALYTAGYLAMLAGLYLWLKEKLWSAPMSVLHVIITVGIVYWYMLVYFPGKYQNELAGMPRRYLEIKGPGFFNFESRKGYEIYIVLSSVFLAAQTLFLINIIGGWRRGRSYPSNGSSP